MCFPRVRSLLVCAALVGIVAVPVLVHGQTQTTPPAATNGAQDSSAPVTSKGQEESLKNEEKANKQRAKAAKDQRKALRAQEKAAKSDKKAGVAPTSSPTPQ